MRAASTILLLTLLLLSSGCRTTKVVEVPVYTTQIVEVPVVVQDTVFVTAPPAELVASINDSEDSFEYVQRLTAALAAYVAWGRYVMSLPTIQPHEDDPVSPARTDSVRVRVNQPTG